MTTFYVIRHPDIDVPGICPDSALDLRLANGWLRVSDGYQDPGDIELTDYADAPDLDAPDGADEDSEAPPAKRRTKKTTEATEESA
ncbi:MAG: hypothetical protein M3N43_13400 [Actinomycetota bacterium]|nr:hypothetical protein [Actinomycetota bacterium]